jgi:hypothetical protein
MLHHWVTEYVQNRSIFEHTTQHATCKDGPLQSGVSWTGTTNCPATPALQKHAPSGKHLLPGTATCQAPHAVRNHPLSGTTTTCPAQPFVRHHPLSGKHPVLGTTICPAPHVRHHPLYTLSDTSSVCSSVLITITNNNCVTLVLKRIIPTERPPLVGEVIANFCG